jgi:hypothetical protein
MTVTAVMMSSARSRPMACVVRELRRFVVSILMHPFHCLVG